MCYQHLTLEERAAIAPMRMLGWTLRQIAQALGRAPSTISREGRRNIDQSGSYAGYWAHLDAQRRRQQAPRAGRLGHPPLAAYVQAKLLERWSPEQIAHRLPLDFPSDPTMRVSHQTLYTWMATDRAADGRWYRCLRQSRRHRRKRYGSGPRPSQIKGRISLTRRPAIVARRGRFGDWEGDTLIGRGRLAAVTTHVERKSRFLLAATVSRRTAVAVTQATRRLFRPLPAPLRKTLTVDNGSEWGAFTTLQQTLQLRVYFATPYAAWERGTNENTNGLLRDYFPKRTDFSGVRPAQLAKVVRALNNRPRKCLAYRTPTEVLRTRLDGALRI
ncbi:MAG TPA: IS30 family transposase [Nitrospira sp.]